MNGFKKMIGLTAIGTMLSATALITWVTVISNANSPSPKNESRARVEKTQSAGTNEPEGMPFPFSVTLGVPFTSQAPLGNWNDIRQNNGCEEASILMAIMWARGITFTPEEAEREIKGMSDFHLENHGHFHDLSNEDTLNLLKDYYHYDRAYLQQNIAVADIRQALRDGKAVIIGVDGNKLGNPYYQLPGPPNHKVIVHGFDDMSRTFIVNDPGTSRGADFRYTYDVFEKALIDYPTGFHEPSTSEKVSMVVVERGK